MSFTTCLGCEEQKRSKNVKFYSIQSIENPLIVINNLRQTYNAKKRKLNEIADIPEKSKICRSCYDLSKAPHILANIDPNQPDLSIYRKVLSSHNRCTFACKNVERLILIPKKIRYDL